MNFWKSLLHFLFLQQNNSLFCIGCYFLLKVFDLYKIKWLILVTLFCLLDTFSRWLAYISCSAPSAEAAFVGRRDKTKQRERSQAEAGAK